MWTKQECHILWRESISKEIPIYLFRESLLTDIIYSSKSGPKHDMLTHIQYAKQSELGHQYLMV